MHRVATPDSFPPLTTEGRVMRVHEVWNLSSGKKRLAVIQRFHPVSIASMVFELISYLVG